MIAAVVAFILKRGRGRSESGRQCVGEVVVKRRGGELDEERKSDHANECEASFKVGSSREREGGEERGEG